MAPPPLLGFNNNVRHRGRVFHIQTEDSGVRHARIVTHLFADGGRIVGTRRLDYSSYLGQADMTVALRRLMKEQHKAMFLTLRAGEFDTEIDRIFGEPGMLTSEQPRADSTLSLPALVSQPAPGSTRSDGLESPRGELSEPSLPASSSESVPRGPHAQEPPRPNSSPGSAPGSLQAALAHAAGGGHSAERDDGPAKHRHESDAEPQSRGVSPEGTRRAAIFGSGVIRPSPSIFDESPGTEDSLGDAILSFLAEDTDRDT